MCCSECLYTDVGYNKVSILGNQMNLLTVPFEGVGDESGIVNLKDVMSTTGLTSFDADAGEPVDYIDTWDIEAGDWGPTYFYVDVPDAGFDDVWTDIDLGIVDVELNVGSSFWLYHGGEDISLDFAGQVMNAASGYTLVGGQMNLCGNPYPTMLNLNDKDQVVITGATSFDADAGEPVDYVDTWNFEAGDWGPTYFYVNVPDAGFDDVWTDIDLGIVDSTEIQPGAGFWYYAGNDGTTFTFVSPFTKK